MALGLAAPLFRRRHASVSVLLLLLLLALLPGGAWAQLRVEVQPLLGVYQGLSSFKTNERVFSPLDNGLVTLAQRTGFALGGAATVWLSPRFGARLHLITAMSDVAATNSNVIGQKPVSSRVTVLGGEALFRVRRLDTGTQVYVSAGGSRIARSGKAYQGFSGTTDLAGTLGVGSSISLNRRLSLQGDVQTLLYRLGLTDASGDRYRSAFQTDLLAYVGLVFQP
jgi:hypothetical protein